MSIYIIKLHCSARETYCIAGKIYVWSIHLEKTDYFEIIFTYELHELRVERFT
jgi:hypothetical protein